MVRTGVGNGKYCVGGDLCGKRCDGVVMFRVHWHCNVRHERGMAQTAVAKKRVARQGQSIGPQGMGKAICSIALATCGKASDGSGKATVSKAEHGRSNAWSDAEMAKQRMEVRGKGNSTEGKATAKQCLQGQGKVLVSAATAQSSNVLTGVGYVMSGSETRERCAVEFG